MTAEQFRAAQQQLKLSTEGVARLFKVNSRVAARWVSGEFDVPFAVAKLLQFIIDGQLLVSDLCGHAASVRSGGKLYCVDCHVELVDDVSRGTMQRREQ